MTEAIILFLGLLLMTVVLAGLATRIGVPYPIILVLGGILLSVVPGLPKVNLESDLILILFLPPLVYSSAWQTSWREFRANLRPILLLSIGLVLATTVLVAVVAHIVLGLPWALAFVLGAIISPTDAVASSTIAQRMHLPRRIVTIIEGESMVNDATGLVVYRFAVAAAVTGSFQLADAGLQFVFVSVGGLLIGLIIAWPIAWLHRRIDNALLEISMTLLTPYAAYLLADTLHTSGILATLSAGLYLSRQSSRFFSSTTRLQANAVWNVLVFLLNGVLFLLIGLQLRGIMETVRDGALVQLVGEVAVMSLAVICIRILWVFLATYVPRWLLPFLRRYDPYPGWRNVTIVAWTGLRGGISLAAALALPLTAASGASFPGRDLLIALTFGIILVTLVGQGLSLIPLIQLIHIPSDILIEKERRKARLAASRAAQERLAELSGQEWVPEDLRIHLQSHYEEQTQRLESLLDGSVNNEIINKKQARHRLHQEVVRAERDVVIGLRDRGQIDDEVLHDIERELDLEEQQLQ